MRYWNCINWIGPTNLIRNNTEFIEMGKEIISIWYSCFGFSIFVFFVLHDDGFVNEYVYLFSRECPCYYWIGWNASGVWTWSSHIIWTAYQWQMSTFLCMFSISWPKRLLTTYSSRSKRTRNIQSRFIGEKCRKLCEIGLWEVASIAKGKRHL